MPVKFLSFLNLKTNFSDNSQAHISKSKSCFNVKSSKYCFHVRSKILTDFHICISVPLMIHINIDIFVNNERTSIAITPLKNMFNLTQQHFWNVQYWNTMKHIIIKYNIEIFPKIRKCRVSLTSWEGHAASAMVGHPSSDGIAIDLPHDIR